MITPTSCFRCQMWQSEGSRKMQVLWLWSALWLMPSGGLARSSIKGILMSLSLLMRWTPGTISASKHCWHDCQLFSIPKRPYFHMPALLNPKMSIFSQKRPSHGGILNSETPGDSKNAFLHWVDVLAFRQHTTGACNVALPGALLRG